MKQFSQLESAFLRGNSTSNELVRHLAQEGSECIASSPQLADASEGRLDSWKEVAAYLRREVRTVQRWEKREGLPVHRHFHNKVASIYAFKTEIDEWRRSRSASLSAAVSPRSGLSAVSAKTLLPVQLEKQFTSPCETNNPLSQGENGTFVHAIIFITRELPVLPKELQSLHLGKLLTVGMSAKSRSAASLGAVSAARAKG